jgi:hypothetical protein
MQESGDSRITTTSRAGQRCDTIGIGCLAGDDNMPPTGKRDAASKTPGQTPPCPLSAGESSRWRVGGGGFQQLEASLSTLRHPRDSDDVNNSTDTTETLLTCVS